MDSKIKTAAGAYNRANRLWRMILNLWEELDEVEPGKRAPQAGYTVDQILSNFNQMISEIKKIKITELEKHYSVETIKEVKHNVNVWKKEGDGLYKRILAMKYFDGVSKHLDRYISELKMTDSEAEKMGGYNTIKRTFMKRLMHPAVIKSYKTELFNISKGRMGQNVFKNLFNNVMFTRNITKKKPTTAELSKSTGHPESWKRGKKWFDTGKNESFVGLKKYIDSNELR